MKIFRGTALATTIAGSLLAGNAQAVNLSGDGIGEVATAPFYTVRDGWETLINLTNTQTVPILVKVRVHESLNSRDVLDFTVGLSANDVFTGIIREAADGSGPVFIARDTLNNKTTLDLDGDGEPDPRVTCTVPRYIAEGLDNDPTVGNAPEIPFSNVATIGDTVDPFFAVDRMREGYIEFIVMGYADNNEIYSGAVGLETVGQAFDAKYNYDAQTNLAPSASPADARATEANGYVGDYVNVFDAIENHDCGALELALDETQNPYTGTVRILETAQQLGEPINALKFNFRLINPERGIEAGLAATAWANFFNPGDVLSPAQDGEISPADNFDPSGNRADPGVAPSDLGYNGACAAYRGRERLTSVDFGDNALTAFTKEGGQEPRGDFDWVPGEAEITTAAVADIVGTSCQNLVAPQKEFGFLDPTFNDAYPVAANFWDDTLNQFVQVTPTTVTVTPDLAVAANDYRGTAVALAGGVLRGIDAVSATIMTDTLVNEWVSKVNGDFGTTSDWVITQPTKSFYVDRDLVSSDADITDEAETRYALEGDRRLNDLYAAINADNANETNLDPALDPFPFAPYEDGFQDNEVGDGRACSSVLYQIYDRAEQVPQVVDPVAPPSGVVVSPQPPVAPADVNPFNGALCFEANVITFNGESAFPTALNRFDIDTDLDLAANQTDTDFTATNGWMRMFLNVDQGAGVFPVLPADVFATDGVAGLVDTGAAGMSGLPLIGFMLKVRTFENATESGLSANYASTVQHAATRAYAP